MVIALPAVLSSRKVRIWLFLKTPWHILNSRTLLKTNLTPSNNNFTNVQHNLWPSLCFPFHLQWRSTLSLYLGNYHVLIKILQYCIYETHVTIEVAKVHKILWSQSLEKGIIYNSCLSLQSGFPTPWCSTATDGSGVHVTGKFLFWILVVASFIGLIFCHCTFTWVVLSFW